MPGRGTSECQVTNAGQLGVTPWLYGRAMTIPTSDEIQHQLAAALRAIRDARCELEAAESAAIRAAVCFGWSVRSVSIELGMSRQAVTQRLQRELGTRRPAAIVRRDAEEARWAAVRQHEETLDAMAKRYFRDQAAMRARSSDCI